MFVGVILNPLARKNRQAGRDREQRIAAILGERGAVVTTHSLDALGPALERLLERATYVVSDGGDGALHWVINETRKVLGGDASAARWPTFVPTNGGTIDFVAYKAGIRGRSEAILRRLITELASGRSPTEVSLDTLHLQGETANGEPFDRLGFALAAGGVGHRFFDKYYADSHPSPATIVRVISRTVTDFALDYVAPRTRNGQSYAKHLFRPTAAKVDIDGRELPYRRHGALHAAAFDVNLGGVLRVFPLARESGVLHFQAGDVGAAEAIANLPRLATGRPLRANGLCDTAGTHMRIEAIDGERLDPIVDGERFHDLVRLEVRPGPRVRIAKIVA